MSSGNLIGTSDTPFREKEYGENHVGFSLTHAWRALLEYHHPIGLEKNSLGMSNAISVDKLLLEKLFMEKTGS